MIQTLEQRKGLRHGPAIRDLELEKGAEHPWLDCYVDQTEDLFQEAHLYRSLCSNMQVQQRDRRCLRRRAAAPGARWKRAPKFQTARPDAGCRTTRAATAANGIQHDVRPRFKPVRRLDSRRLGVYPPLLRLAGLPASGVVVVAVEAGSRTIATSDEAAPDYGLLA